MVKTEGKPRSMVNTYKTRLAFVANLLNSYDVEYVVVGAEAGQMHGVVRATKDVDILLKKTRENVKKALDALSKLAWGIAKEMVDDLILSKDTDRAKDKSDVEVLSVIKKNK